MVAWSAGGTTLNIAIDGAGTTISHLDIRSLGASGSERVGLVANGAVTATDLALTATGVCARLQAPTASRLGPDVTASLAPASTTATCIEAGLAADDVVTGVTVAASGAFGVSLARSATLTDSTINATFALNMAGGTVRRSTLNGEAIGATVYGYPTPAQITDSVVAASSSDGIGVVTGNVGGLASAVRLRNVTAVGGLVGLDADAGSGGIDARNVIARGGGHDVVGSPATSSGCGGPCPAASVTIGYSNFTTTDGPVDTTSIGHNQSANPLLVNPVLGSSQDFHIASAGSPLIGAGTPDPSDGPSDRDGVAHADRPSIGAYEYPVAPAAQPGTPPPVPAASGPTANTSTRPTISSLAETNAVFAVTRTSTPLHGRTAAARHKRGTIFSFRLDQPATVTIVITTSTNCARPEARTRGNRRCARTVARLTRSVHGGLDKLPFSGRIRGKPLKPADYRAVFVATSAGGSSAPRTLHFRIVSR